ncbi:MAG: hypothetical protein R6V85_19785 [Polyangia bacterium]
MLLGGFFGGEVVVGQGEPDETVLQIDSSHGGTFLARYEPDGSLRWAWAIPTRHRSKTAGEETSSTAVTWPGATDGHAQIGSRRAVKWRRNLGASVMR